MLHYLIMSRSLTYAQRTVRVLERAGISASVTKAPPGAVSTGCGYGVKISERRLSDALKALKSGGFGPTKVFLETENGAFREVSGLA